MRKLKKKHLRKKVKKVYKPAICKYYNEDGVRCKNKAVGSSTLCRVHGGEIRTKDLIESKDDNPLSYKTSKFNPKLHPLLYIDLSRQGFTDVEIAAEMQISPVTLRSWAEKYSEFAYAVEIGQAMVESWYLQQAKGNLSNARFQTGLFKFLAMNKLNYTEKNESRNMNMNASVGVLVVPEKMTIDEWEAKNIEDAEYEEIGQTEGKEAN